MDYNVLYTDTRENMNQEIVAQRENNNKVTYFK